MRPPHNSSSLGAESNYSRPRQIVHCPLSIVNSNKRFRKLHGIKGFQVVYAQTNFVCLGAHFIQIFVRNEHALRQGFAFGKTLGRRKRRAACGG